MIILSVRHLSWCLVGLFLSIMVSSVLAGEEDQEMRYLFAGMLQERGKLKSWSCTITGMDPENLAFEMKLLSNREKVRFARTQHLPAYDGKTYQSVNGKAQISGKVVHLLKRDEVVHACDNTQMTVYWNASDSRCNIYRSTHSHRQLLHLWDPRMAGLVLNHDETDYQKAINDRLKYWREVPIKVEHKGALWTVTATKSYEWQDIRLSITVDTEHGFTPVLYRNDTLYKPNSKFPGKTEVYYETTAKWEQLDEAWVPVHHRHVKGDGTVVREYKISWDWINKDIDDKEFTLDALGVPDDVPKIYFDEKGQEIRKDTPFSFGENRAIRRSNRPWIRWGVYSLGFLLIALALLRYRLRKRPSSPT